MGWADRPLEEVDDAEASSQVLNFVESDGLSRVRVRHVDFTPFIDSSRTAPTSWRWTDVAGLKQMEEASVWIFGFSRWNIRKKKKEIGRLFGCILGSRSSDAFSSLDSNLLYF